MDIYRLSYQEYYQVDALQEKSVVVDRIGRLVGFSMNEQKGIELEFGGSVFGTGMKGVTKSPSKPKRRQGAR